jgi:MFS family permease
VTAHSTSPTPAARLDRPAPPVPQGRTLAVLSAAQVIGGVGIGAAVSVGALLVQDVSGSAAWSGLAATLSTLGAAIAAIPLARLADRSGRRIALGTGWLVAAGGAAAAVAAGVQESFPLLILGLTMIGAGNAAGLQSRFAATDLAGSGDRARALALVVWATTVGAVAGPNLTRPGAAVADLFGVPPLTGPFLFSAVAGLVASAILAVALRPDPLLTAKGLLIAPSPARGPDVAEAVREVTAAAASARPPSTIATIFRTPMARSALLATVTGHAVMVAVMAMTPVHLHGHGAGLTVIGLTISLHIAGMFAFSPLVGWIADRYGRRPAMLGGFALLIGATLTTATAGDSTVRVTAGLIALGLGWSFTSIAGSTQLSESVPVTARPKAQGTSDLLMNLAGASAGALSGLLVATIDYSGLSLVAAALTLPALALVLLQPADGLKVVPAQGTGSEQP